MLVEFEVPAAAAIKARLEKSEREERVGVTSLQGIRSLIDVSLDQLPTLIDKVDRVRGYVLQNGGRYPEANYEYEIERDWTTPKAMELYRYYKDADFQAGAYVEMPDLPEQIQHPVFPPERLALFYNDVGFRYNFDDTFSLELDFSGKDRIDDLAGILLDYGSELNPLSQMSDEEYDIAEYCLDRFIATHD